jgi:beta-aspartyl-peptidase (threonine type)
MTVARWAWGASVAVLMSGCAPSGGGGGGDPQVEIAAMLQRSASDWNRGDLAGFMGDYARDSLTSYVNAGHVQYGWQKLYDRYQAVYFAPGKTRDSLAFEEVRVRPLTRELALCTARFKLLRGDSVTASGPFTLLLQKRGERWRILHDHTSADPR